MTPLYQRLKELDFNSFELLVTHLLKERFPNAAIKHIDGTSGDQGLDIVVGQLDQHPTIWQCKSFPNGIRKSQKQQIRDSLNRALNCYAPERWILCISIDMDAKVFTWFQCLAESRRDSTDVVLYQATDIVHELLYRTTIRERFFPNVVLNTTEIREIVTKTSELTTEELATLTTENMSLYLNRLQERDQRFTYAVTFSRDREPDTATALGELVTIKSGETTIHVYPRDHEAIRAYPPEAHFTLIDASLEKIKEHIRAGTPQDFSPGEITSFSSDFDFLLPSAYDPNEITLSIQPQKPKELLAFRVTFGRSERAITYEYVPFQRSYTGAEQTTFESTGRFPFQMILLIGKDGSGSLAFRETEAEVHDIQKFLKALNVAFNERAIQFYDLAKDKMFFSPKLSGMPPQWLDRYTAFINEAVTVADTFQVTLTKPVVITSDDEHAIHYLAQLADGLTIDPKEITLCLTKVRGTESMLEALFAECSYKIITKSENVVVFGTQVPTGSLEYELARARIKNATALLELVQNAPMGTPATLVLAPSAPFAVKRHSNPNAELQLQFALIQSPQLPASS